MIDDAISVIATGSNITTSGTSARVAIPATASTNAPFYVRVSCTTKSYIRLGDSTITAAAGDLMLDPTESVILKVCRATHIAALQVASAGVVNVVPLEDV